MDAGNPNLHELTRQEAVGAGERTGPGVEAMGCPSCGTIFRLTPGSAGGLFRCPCGHSFALDDLLAKDGESHAPPASAAALEAAAFKREAASATRQGMSRTVEGAAPGAALTLPPGGGLSFGKYRIVEEVARGGMGVVYRARQEGLNREVALKMLLAGEGASEDQVKRFLREAESAAKLSHPNIVPIYDVGVEEGRHFFTMEFVRGESIADVLDRMGMIPPRQSLKIAHDVAVALQYAHEHGILHRDIKPGNVMLAPRDEKAPEELKEGDSIAFNSGLHGSYRVLVTDFGLAKDMSGESVLTLSGTALGTPVYMSPEQAEGDLSALGPPSDVYSLGAVLYEMVTGEEPFEGASVGQILTQVIMNDPPPPRKRLPGLSKDVETIILTAMAKEPNRRYKTAGAMAEDMERYLKGEAISARPASIAYRVGKKLRRNKLASALAVLMMLILLGAVVAVERTSALKRRQIREQAEARFVEGRELLSRGKFLDAERAFGEALGLHPEWPSARDGIRDAKMARMLSNARELLGEDNFKGAGMVLEEAGTLAPEDPEYRRLRRLQLGTASLCVKSAEPGLCAWWIPALQGVTWLAEFMSLPAGPGGPMERLGELPLGPVDRPFGDGTLVLTRGGEVLSAFHVSIPRNAEVLLDRRVFKVGLEEDADFEDLESALKAATPGSVIELESGSHSGQLKFSIPGLTLRPMPGHKPVITGAGEVPVLAAEKSPGLRIEGIEIAAAGAGGLSFTDCPGAIVTGCKLSGGKGTLLNLSNCPGAVVCSNTMENSLEAGMVLGSCHDALVAGNLVHHVGWAGAYLPTSDRLLFARNYVHHAQRMSIFTHKAQGLVILENVTHHNPQWGIIAGEKCSNVRVEGNFVHDTVFQDGTQRAEGIALVNVEGAGACLHNTVFRSTTGILMLEAHGTRAFDNLVFDCVTGLHHQSAGPVDYNCFWNNRVMAQWIDQRVYTLKELREVFGWRDKKMEHGQEKDPCFADPENDDYTLTDESPCRGAASDGKDLGADFEVVQAVREGRFDRKAWFRELYVKRLSGGAAAARSAGDETRAKSLEGLAALLPK